MKNILSKRIPETLMVGVIGGYLFYLGHLPLPWVLGAMAAVMLWQSITKREMVWPSPFKNGGILFLGIYFGLYFTKDTFLSVSPYLLPYILVTVALILISIINSTLITRWIPVDRITSVFGSIPGGLTEMVIASEALKAKSSLVAIFQTVRLLTVLFIVPFLIVHAFTSDVTILDTPITSQNMEGSTSNYFWFLFPIILGILLRNSLPAGIVIVPLIITALLNVSVIELPALPPLLLIAAQVTVGIGMGKTITLSDLKLGGKYCFVYFGLALTLIVVSFLFGAILAQFTSLTLATALLSVAPGGLIEMVLTASAVGADPAIVSALQLIRIFIIIVFVPPVLKWYFRKKELHEAA
ncbi:membrane AbrB-like protein [Evansella vedderi]|uniref:Membrane AbrB-like protein n=1 Tax=Evansella vedderi TaxID=38282 RepID=A0ABT9ZV96_9BACI|nr:AbrB family transcriptional regulator [Evansella vedderi]MDQ0255139.1 membrane AbrB-like protein [Evansella vedderi]